MRQRGHEASSRETGCHETSHQCRWQCLARNCRSHPGDGRRSGGMYRGAHVQAEPFTARARGREQFGILGVMVNRGEHRVDIDGRRGAVVAADCLAQQRDGRRPCSRVCEIARPNIERNRQRRCRRLARRARRRDVHDVTMPSRVAVVVAVAIVIQPVGPSRDDRA